MLKFAAFLLIIWIYFEWFKRINLSRKESWVTVFIALKLAPAQPTNKVNPCFYMNHNNLMIQYIRVQQSRETVFPLLPLKLSVHFTKRFSHKAVWGLRTYRVTDNTNDGILMYFDICVVTHRPVKIGSEDWAITRAKTILKMAHSIYVSITWL